MIKLLWNTALNQNDSFELYWGKYHEKNSENHRNICLIPESAHGTNFTSARLAGLKIKKYSDNLSVDEFETWIQLFDNYGLSGLRATGVQKFGRYSRIND